MIVLLDYRILMLLWKVLWKMLTLKETLSIYQDLKILAIWMLAQESHTLKRKVLVDMVLAMITEMYSKVLDNGGLRQRISCYKKQFMKKQEKIIHGTCTVLELEALMKFQILNHIILIIHIGWDTIHIIQM